MNITSEESRGHVLSALLKLIISCFTPVFGSIANHVSIFLPRKKTVSISCNEWNTRRILVIPVSVFYEFDNQRTVHHDIFLKQNQRDARISWIYFWNRTLHVSDKSSVHHQESSTVHTAISICHTGFADCLLVESVYSIHSWWRTENLSKTCRVLILMCCWPYIIVMISFGSNSCTTILLY